VRADAKLAMATAHAATPAGSSSAAAAAVRRKWRHTRAGVAIAPENKYNSPVPVVQVAALMELYHATAGADWVRCPVLTDGFYSRMILVHTPSLKRAACGHWRLLE
jgi:hypothetical protein